MSDFRDKILSEIIKVCNAQHATIGLLLERVGKGNGEPEPSTASHLGMMQRLQYNVVRREWRDVDDVRCMKVIGPERREGDGKAWIQYDPNP